MCVAISGQDVLDYIFSSDPERRAVSYDEIDAFRSAFVDSVTESGADNPYYATVYYEPLRDLSESHYDGILVKRLDGIHLFGSVKAGVCEAIESRYDDRVVSSALKRALRTGRPRRGEMAQ